MPAPSVTYTFTDGTTAYGSEVQQNFADLVAALTDGSKDLSINNLVTAGSVTLGDAAADAITWNGTAPSILLDNAATDGGAIYFNAGSADYIKSNAAGTAIEVTGFANFVVTTAGAVTAAAGISGTTGVFSSTLSATSGTFSLGVSADYLTVTTDDTSAPAANYLYQANIPKAWACLTAGAAGTVTVTDDHNISSASWSNWVMTVQIDTNMANATYSVVADIDSASGNFYESAVTCSPNDSASFHISQYDPSTAIENWESGDIAWCILMGDQ